MLPAPCWAMPWSLPSLVELLPVPRGAFEFGKELLLLKQSSLGTFKQEGRRQSGEAVH